MSSAAAPISVRFTPREALRAAPAWPFARVIAVMSGKGGVGKSTVALNLALALRGQGLRVGLLDVDITNPNIPRMVGLEDFRFEPGNTAPPQIDGVPVASTQFFAPPGEALVWRGPMKQKMIAQLATRVAWPELDVLVVDLPPGTSDEPLSVAEMFKGRAEAVLVTTPQRVSTDDVAKSASFARKLGMPILGVVENMSAFRCACGREHEIFGAGGGERVARELNVALLGQVPIEPKLVRGGDSGKPIVLSEPDAPAARAIVSIAEGIRRAWDQA